MWSDTLLALERAHLLRLLVWGGTSVVVGTGLLAWLMVRRYDSALLRSFSLQTSLWGLVNLAIAGRGLSRLADRDLGSATQLDRLLWLSTGLDIGLILVGLTLAATGWIVGRRLGAVGAGIGVLVQGAGLLFLDLRFLSITARIF
jgi:uncharacterized protein DUF6992